MRAFQAVVSVLALAFAIVSALEAQEARGTLLGRITDPSKAVIVGAQIEVLNTGTGVRLKSATNASGDCQRPRVRVA